MIAGRQLSAGSADALLGDGRGLANAVGHVEADQAVADVQRVEHDPGARPGLEAHVDVDRRGDGSLRARRDDRDDGPVSRAPRLGLGRLSATQHETARILLLLVLGGRQELEAAFGESQAERGPQAATPAVSRGIRDVARFIVPPFFRLC
jgi:hypothetical protein